ncbi:hypothetical protein HMPREF0262_01227 [Clostridium sp. ATCC 29733]|nr:hypothetical protein HMPREF0262_01227 [Clostridium sp. ATCC 29733]
MSRGLPSFLPGGRTGTGKRGMERRWREIGGCRGGEENWADRGEGKRQTEKGRWANHRERRVTGERKSGQTEVEKSVQTEARGKEGRTKAGEKDGRREAKEKTGGEKSAKRQAARTHRKRRATEVERRSGQREVGERQADRGGGKSRWRRSRRKR